MSLVLKAFIVLWIIENVLSFPHTFHIILGKIPGLRESLGIGFIPFFEWHFWTVIWERSFSCSIPVAVFFLTIDRSLALLLGLHYKPIHKIIICTLCLLLVAFATAVTLYIYVDGHMRPRPMFPSTNGTGFGNGTWPGTNGTFPGVNGTLFGANGTINGTFSGVSGKAGSTLVGGNGATNGTNFSNYTLTACRATVCFFEKPDDWQFLVRVTFGTLNFACSLNFFYLLRKQNAKMFMYTYKSTAKNTVRVLTKRGY
ncbi:hypothetical protein AAVH_17156 [Aphelenchoides avenae]|nr:hypothetical protein AAVH_17156 [Aphelenchus avenae]